MLRSIITAVAITLVGLALVVLASMVAVDAVTASAPKKVTFEEGVVCSLWYQPRNSDYAIAMIGPDLPGFTVRSHKGVWDQISFDGDNAVIPIEGAGWKKCPIFFPLPGVT